MEKIGVQLLLEPEAIKLLKEHNIAYPDYGIARSEKEAVEIADSLGYPVVLKVVSPQVVHKSDAGGVKVNLINAGETKRGYQSIIYDVKHCHPNADIQGVIVAKQAADGQEIIIGMIDDDIFGKTLMFGMGGIFTEVFNDVAFKVCPLNRKNAEDMISEIKGYPILKGMRGREGIDIDALAELLVKVSDLIMKYDSIHEIDLNPVRLYKNGLLVLDARIIVKDG